MLLLPDQTYEQYQGEKALPKTPLSELKRILSEATPLPPKSFHFIKSAVSAKTPTTNGNKPTAHRTRITNVQTHLEAFFGVMGNTQTTKGSHIKYKEYRVPTPEGFEQTAEFFNNIPEFHGEALGPFSIPKQNKLSYRTEDLLKECEELLNKYRIKPDFFCRYRKAMDESNRSAAKPTSWPRSRIESHTPKVPTPDRRKPHSSTQSSRNHHSSIRRMKRFQKSTAIYTLPNREKRPVDKVDASSSNEAVHLQQRLKSLSSELVTLRNRLHVDQTNIDVPLNGDTAPATAAAVAANVTATANALNLVTAQPPPPLPPATTPHLTNGPFVSHHTNMQNGTSTILPVAKTSPKAYQMTPNTLPHGINSVPLVSPRNTSIPHPLPHHIGKNHVDITTNGNGTLRRAPPETGAKPHTRIISPSKTVNSPHKILPKDMDDLIHLQGPLTEDAVMRTLHARFNDGKYITNVGPILLSINPYVDVGNPLTLSSTRTLELAVQLRRIVLEAVRQQAETGYPQAIILSGTSGAGKTHCSMLLLRQLFAVAGGGPETDAFKHLAAAFTVLRSLGSAKTSTNSESSRIGQFIEVQVTDGALYRTKIHCYFLDQTRVIRPLANEKNYHIFYQMLAGLSRDERIKLNLEGYSANNLRYLQGGDTRQDEKEDAARFQAWKTCLGILGIPFLDVVRVLAAVLLLGNVQFVDGQGLEVDIKGESELNAISCLLGVPAAALFRGLTTRTHNARNQLVKSVCDANMSNMTRDSLAKALYCRTVATIVRRANSLKRLGSTLGTLSSDSNESVHNQGDIASQHASTIGGNSGSKSMAALNNAVRHATDGFIGILDMFGFENPKPSQLEHLCINLCAETMQHFYNTHIFKSSVESCRDEGIMIDTDVDYVDNVPCIDLISSLRTGLLSMLDTECAVRGTAESYVAKIKVQHRNSTRLENKQSELQNPRAFVIRHFAGCVEYDTTDFLDTNRDVVSDDLVSVFYKHTCNFGFATHLFGSELKALYAVENVPRGLSFRIAPTSHTDLLNGDEPVSTLTQDFHTRLDNLLRTLVHARPHFVRCIRSNAGEVPGTFERQTIVKQIRALQVLETVNLMASGFPHRMRFKHFTGRYRMIAPFHMLRRNEEKALEDCKIILQIAMDTPPDIQGTVTLSWAPGKRHTFLSEGIRQHLEKLRTDIRMRSATIIQAMWRGYSLRRRLGSVKRTKIITLPNTQTNGTITTASRPAVKTAAARVTRPRPQPIAGTPPPDPNEKCDANIIQQTCNLFGLDLERPPPVPPSRSYTVTGNSKLGYPQTRIMKMSFPEFSALNPPTKQLRKGEQVTCVGASHRRGHLIVQQKGVTFHVPFQYMELVKSAQPASVNI